MINLPKFFGKVLSQLVAHKILILVLMPVVLFGAGALGARSFLLSKIKIPKINGSDIVFLNSPSASLDSSVSQPSDTPSASDDSVLGISNDSTGSNTGGTNITFTPAPSPTDTPFPSYSPITTIYTSPTSPSSSCSGTPTDYYSEVYINGSKYPVTVSAGSSAAITVDLEDCNYSKVSSDHLTITLTSGDSGTTINGTGIGSGYNAQAQNGQYTFQVSSSNPTTAVFKIQDTDRNFTVTMPNYAVPQVTFTNGSTSGNSNCTTGAGVPNAWYSDVYQPSGSVDIGSTATFSIVIRDCFQAIVPVTDTLDISLNSGDSSTKVNGQTPTTSITTSGGQASFSVTSENPTTDTFIIQDTTSSFTVTDPNNHNPSVNFSSSSTPTPSPSATETPTPAPVSTPTPTPTSTPDASSSASPSP